MQFYARKSNCRKSRVEVLSSPPPRRRSAHGLYFTFFAKAKNAGMFGIGGMLAQITRVSRSNFVLSVFDLRKRRVD